MVRQVLLVLGFCQLFSCLLQMDDRLSFSTYSLLVIYKCFNRDMLYSKSPNALLLSITTCFHRKKENIYESALDTTNNKTCVTSEDSDQPVHPRSLIRVFTDRMCLQLLRVT